MIAQFFVSLFNTFNFSSSIWLFFSSLSWFNCLSSSIWLFLSQLSRFNCLMAFFFFIFILLHYSHLTFFFPFFVLFYCFIFFLHKSPNSLLCYRIVVINWYLCLWLPSSAFNFTLLPPPLPPQKEKRMSSSSLHKKPINFYIPRH